MNPMNITKTFALFSLVSVLTVSCTKEVSIPEQSVSDPVQNKAQLASQTPSSTPDSFDVFCFEDNSLTAPMRDTCSPSKIFQIRQGSKNKAYFKKITSVQGGNQTIPYVSGDPSMAKITPEKMESLAAADANIYLIKMVMDIGIGASGERAIRVMKFDRNSGKFDIYKTGDLQEKGEGESTVYF